MSEIDNFDASNKEETLPDSSPENTQEDKGTSPDAKKPEDQAEDFSKYPLDKHPRWAERERDWNRRFEEQEASFQAKLDAITNGKKDGNSEKIDKDAEIPEWFGGDQKAWDSYISWHNQEIVKAEDRAYNRISQTQKTESDKVAEANKWFEDSIAEIESSGEKVDRNALLQAALENELIDSKGRWNYKAAWKLLKGSSATPTAKDPAREQRKNLADATTKESGKGDGNKPAYKTSEDFKKDRPW